MTTIGQVAGIDHVSATRLRKVGIKTAEAFLERARGPEGVRSLSRQTGIESGKLIDMATSVDLMRLQGMGARYAALLRAAGVNNLEDLAVLAVEDFLADLTVANHQHRIVRRLPSSQSLQAWIDQACGYNSTPGKP